MTWVFATAVGALILVSRSAWEESSLLSDLLFATGLLLVGVATVGRLWCSLYICGYKTNTLVTAGPYSVCRNPLYLFSLLGGAGVGLATETLTVTLILLVAFALYYPLVILAEERRLRATHGDDFERYAARTPRFWPSFAEIEEPEEYVVKPRRLRKAIFDAMGFIWMAGILEVIEALHEHNALPVFFRLY